LLKEHASIIAGGSNRQENRLTRAIHRKDIAVIHEYVHGVELNFVKELIFNYVKSDRSRIIFNATTGLMAKALQVGLKQEYQNPVVVQGLLVTSDNKLILGVRSKPPFRAHLPDEPFDHKIMLCPTGYASFNYECNLRTCFYKELAEELGLFEKDLSALHILGHVHEVGFTEGVRIFFFASTSLSSIDLVKRWKKAPHHWEYEALFGIEFNPTSLTELLTTQEFSRYAKQANGILKQSVFPILQYLLQDTTILL
jgi:ADP-ribose pyrophosphatase YjhB (NUDIX family)